MKTEDILNLDCEKAENRKKLSSIILKMKPVQKVAEREQLTGVDIPLLERILHSLCLRYGYSYQGIGPYYEYEYGEDGKRKNKKFVFYKTDVMTPDRQWGGTVYGKTYWEILSKLVIKIYAGVRAEEKGYAGK